MIYRNRNRASRRYRANENLNRMEFKHYAHDAEAVTKSLTRLWKEQKLKVDKINARRMAQNPIRVEQGLKPYEPIEYPKETLEHPTRYLKRLSVGEVNKNFVCLDDTERYVNKPLYISTKFLETGVPDLVFKVKDVQCKYLLKTQDEDGERVVDPDLEKDPDWKPEKPDPKDADLLRPHVVDFKILNFWNLFMRDLKMHFEGPLTFNAMTQTQRVKIVYKTYAGVVKTTAGGADIQVRCDCEDFINRIQDAAAQGNWLFLGESDLNYWTEQKTGMDDPELGVDITDSDVMDAINQVTGADREETLLAKLYRNGPACKHILSLVFNVRKWQDPVIQSIAWLLSDIDTCQRLFDEFGN